MIESSGSDTDSDESEHYRTQRRKGMSAEERLHLLNAEIADIERNVSVDQKEDVDGILKQLMEYRARISGVSSRRARPLEVRENGREHEEETEEKVEQPPQHDNLSEDTRLLTLDERLRALEKSVGTDTIGVSTDVSTVRSHDLAYHAQFRPAINFPRLL